jgi:hypothetical protein
MADAVAAAGLDADAHAPLQEARMAISHTLVWIDAHEAIIVGHRGDEIVIERIGSDAPDHHRGTGNAPHPSGDPQRNEHLRRFVRIVADRLPVADDLTVLGPGTVREHLEHELVVADGHQHRTRTVVTAPAERMTDRQLVARLCREAGVEPRRRTVGAYRWSGHLATSRSRRREAVPVRVSEKRVDDRSHRVPSMDESAP